MSRVGYAACVAAFVLGLCWPSAHAAEPAIDRALVERLVRAVEAQTRAIERCDRR